MTTIAVPVDETPFSERAVPVAEALAGALDGSIRLLTVSSEGISRLGDEQYLSQLAAGLDVPSSWRALRTTESAGAALAAALRQEAEPGTLVCMAAHGRTRARLVLSSVSEELLHVSPHPVILVGPSARPPAVPIKRLIICLDGSAIAEAVLPPAIDLAARLGANVTLLHVMDQPHSGHLVHGYMADVVRQLGGIPAHIAVHTAGGAGPAKVIVEHSAETGAGLIAMATHGRTGLRRALLGSVAQSVVHHAGCPVLVVTA
jgi:nucleotide-binding universal stress UspA family protein